MFLVFTGDYYYPSGGWRDFVGMAGSLEDAIKLDKNDDWFHVVQLGVGIVYSR